MQPYDTIRLESSTRGQYECQAIDFDNMIYEYGHLTILALQSVIEGMMGVPYGSHPLTSRTEAFMVLAELRGYATN